jgi:hypothetical protein
MFGDFHSIGEHAQNDASVLGRESLADRSKQLVGRYKDMWSQDRRFSARARLDVADHSQSFLDY